MFNHRENNRGFWLGVPWQRQGLMSEAVHAITEFWFETLHFPVLRAPKASENLAFIRISQKAGMRLESRSEQSYVCGRRPSECWFMTCEEWLATRPPEPPAPKMPPGPHR